MVRFYIPGPLRAFAGGSASIVLPGSPATAGEALDLLSQLHPGVTERVVTETGEVRPHVNVFVGEESIRDVSGLATPLSEGCEISILPAVSGG
jgi:molybdopterin converting factor small subunit